MRNDLNGHLEHLIEFYSAGILIDSIQPSIQKSLLSQAEPTLPYYFFAIHRFLYWFALRLDGFLLVCFFYRLLLLFGGIREYILINVEKTMNFFYTHFSFNYLILAIRQYLISF
ncbi:MAG: hypothetical protein BRD50_09530 [Bacteroidetes bacterium SW_11_45_7]|nr:MAG: hypothetical protein BRD50_09530 [Bacteroidetes bacterium SW_11_45_7]